MGRTHRSVEIKENLLEFSFSLRIARIGRFFPRIGGRIGTDWCGSVGIGKLLRFIPLAAAYRAASIAYSRAAPTWRPCGSHVALTPSHALPCSRMLCHARAVKLSQALSCSVMTAKLTHAVSCSLTPCHVLSCWLRLSRILARCLILAHAL